MLQRGEGVSLWRQIAREIEDDIRRQTFRPGERLPTEMDLTRRFGVNRHTVRRALAALAEEGVVRAEQGRGTFVQEGVIDYRIGRRTRFRETVRSQQKDPGGRLLQSGHGTADAAVAQALRLPVGAPVVSLEHVRFADGQPIVVGAHYLPAERFSGFLEAYEATSSITDALARFGVSDYFRKSTRVTARLPDAEEMRLLNLPRSRPVLVTESINVDPEGAPIEYGIARFAADRVHLVFEP